MFLNVLMLAGIGGAAVPLVLHLLSKARYRTVDWGAMMFLDMSESRRRETSRLKQLLLLLIRMAIVATLAVALARPVVQGKWGGVAAAGGGERVTAAIVLDRSASMAFEEGVTVTGGQGHTRLDLAREVVLQILRGLNRGDQVSLILTDDPAIRTGGIVAPTGDRQAVVDRVIQLKPGLGRADLAAAVTTAVTTLDRFEKSNPQLYVVCDRQAGSWAGVNEAFKQAQASRGASAGALMRGFILPVGGEQTDNVAVESVSLVSPPAIAGASGEVQITVHNYGKRPRPGLPLSVRQDDHAPSETAVNLAPGAASTVRVPLTFGPPGSEAIVASVKSTGLTLDDEFEFAADVSKPISTLIVSGDDRPSATSSPGGFDTAADYLRVALQPFKTMKRAGSDPAVVTVIPAAGLEDKNLDPFQVIVLAGMADFTPQQANAIEQFVYTGGGLLIAPGSRSRADAYNRALYRDGAGVLPASLRPAVPGDASSTAALRTFDPSSPVFNFLKGRPDAAASAAISRYFPATPREWGGARAIAYYASGEPFAVESDFGRGRAILLTTPLDADWGTLPSTSFYLPFVQSAVRHLAEGGRPVRNLDPGQEIVATFDELPPDRHAILTTPDGMQHPLDVASAAGGRFEARFADTFQPGVYTVEARQPGAAKPLRFVVRAPKEESDLTPLTDADWKHIEDATGLRRVELGRQSLADVVGTTRGGRELWLTLLLTVLVLATLEMGLTRFWSAGQK